MVKNECFQFAEIVLTGPIYHNALCLTTKRFITTWNLHQIIMYSNNKVKLVAG